MKIILELYHHLHTKFFPTCFSQGYEVGLNPLGVCRVHSPTNALIYFEEHIKIYIKMHINIAPTCFGLRPTSGSLHWTWLKLYLC